MSALHLDCEEESSCVTEGEVLCCLHGGDSLMASNDSKAVLPCAEIKIMKLESSYIYMYI